MNAKLYRDPQTGEVTLSEGRKLEIVTLDKMFDYIRMLDMKDCPKAFIDHGNFRLVFSRPVLRAGRITCDVEIKEKVKYDKTFIPFM